MDLFKLVGSVFIDTDQADKSLKKTSKSSEGLANKLGKGLGTAAKVGTAAVATIGAAATGAVAGVTKLTGAVAEHGDNIDKASQKLGISAEGYQKWNEVLKHSGTSIDAMGAGFKTLSNAVQNGSKTQMLAFQKLGLSMDDLKKMSTEEVFETVIGKLQGMEEGTERTALSTQLLGRSGTQLGALLNTSAEDTQKMLDKVEKLGGVMSNDAVKASAKYQDSLQDLQTAVEGTKNALGSKFLPAITDVMDGFSLLMQGEDTEGAEKLTNGVNNLLDNMGKLAPEIKKVATPILKTIGDAILEGLPSLANTGVEIVETIFNTGVDVAPDVLGFATNAINSLIDMLGSAAKSGTADDSKLQELGQAVIDMMTGIDWGGLVINTLALVEVLFDKIISGIEQYAEEHPEVATAVAGVLMLVLKLASSGVTLEAVKTALAPIGGTVLAGFVGALAAAFAGFSVGKWIGDNYLTSDNMKEYQIDFKLTDFLKFDSEDWSDFWQAFADWWVDVESWWADKKSKITSAVSGLWSGMAGSIKRGINTYIISNINKLIDGLNTAKNAINALPGVNIGDMSKVPMLAKGGEITASGYSIVGEKGAELINLPRGASVLPINDNNNALSNVESLLAQLLETTRANADKQIVMDSGALVGATTSGYNKSLGTVEKFNARGVYV